MPGVRRDRGSRPGLHPNCSGLLACGNSFHGERPGPSLDGGGQALGRKCAIVAAAFDAEEGADADENGDADEDGDHLRPRASYIDIGSGIVAAQPHPASRMMSSGECFYKSVRHAFDGHGSFLPPNTYASGSNLDSIAVGDFNGDGLPDLVVSNAEHTGLCPGALCLPTGLGAGTVGVFINRGDGSFAPQATYRPYSSWPAFQIQGLRRTPATSSKSCVMVYWLRADSIAKASSEAVYRKVTRYLGQLTGKDKDQQLTLDHLQSMSVMDHLTRVDAPGGALPKQQHEHGDVAGASKAGHGIGYVHGGDHRKNGLVFPWV